MNYEQLKKDAHTLYLRGDMSQKMAVSIMGLKPSKRWIVQKMPRGHRRISHGHAEGE